MSRIEKLAPDQWDTRLVAAIQQDMVKELPEAFRTAEALAPRGAETIEVR